MPEAVPVGGPADPAASRAGQGRLGVGPVLGIVVGALLVLDRRRIGRSAMIGRERQARTEEDEIAREPGPSALWLVRHGESMGNLADARAHEAGADRLELDVRDPDVELSERGRHQAEALGRWLARLDDDERPTAVLSSPFRRAQRTAEIAAAALGLPVRADERLRERDFGVFDGMTGAGIRDRFPDEARRRELLGKFYYRPPSGESWADVALRIRSLLATEALRHDGGRLLVVAHQAVIMVFRYVLEELGEQELLDIDRHEQIANASVTRYGSDDEGRLVLRAFNCVDHLLDEHETVTREPHAQA